VPACPFGVIEVNMAPESGDGKAHKCTLCYDRLKDDLEPACAKACPTDSIQFGDLSELKARARQRVDTLRDKGLHSYIYGDEEVGGTGGIDGLNAFFLLLDKPQKYNLPEQPSLPQNHTFPGIFTMAATAVLLGVATAWSLKDE
jgi:formate dehydrogenase iron-sulfur subunit